MYKGSPHTSGRFLGAGPRKFKPRVQVIQKRGRNFSDVHLSDPTNIKKDVPDFDPELEFEYTPRELLLLAEKMLLEDEKPPYEYPAWLNGSAMRDRLKREIYCSAGTPDPSIVEGMYWRTHPDGRPWQPEDLRRGGGLSFYGVRTTSAEAVPAPPIRTRRLPKQCRFEGCLEDARVKGLCPAHRAQENAGSPLRPVKRYPPKINGLSRLAVKLKEQVDRKEAKENPAGAGFSVRL
jgi:hypothetical protein